jgi:hypothetical protein
MKFINCDTSLLYEFSNIENLLIKTEIYFPLKYNYMILSVNHLKL